LWVCDVLLRVNNPTCFLTHFAFKHKSSAKHQQQKTGGHVFLEQNVANFIPCPFFIQTSSPGLSISCISYRNLRQGQRHK
jgi:hypothetical protein